MECPFLLEQERPTHGQKKKHLNLKHYPPQIPRLEPFEKEFCNCQVDEIQNKSEQFPNKTK